MLIEDYKDELSWEILLKIKRIFDKSINIENIIKEVLDTHKDEKVQVQYDILIIDDDDSTIQLLSEFFRKKGYSSIEVTSGAEAIKLLKHSIPKMILLDILLPDKEGDEICKIIKSDKKLKDVPVFYITAIPESEVSKKLKETGAEGYFLKPFNMKEFNTLFDYLNY